MSSSKMHFAIFIILSSLCCVLSSKSEEQHDKNEFHAKSQASNFEVRNSDKEKQLFSTSTDVSRERVNISSDYNPLTSDIEKSNANTSYPVDATRLKYKQKLLEKEIQKAAMDLLQPGDFNGITYILAKETSQTRDEIQHKFLKTPRISENSVAGRLVRRKKEYQENQKTENVPVRTEEDSLNNSSVKSAISKLLTNVKNSTSKKMKSFQEPNNGAETNKDSNTGNIFPSTKEHFAEKSNGSLFRTTDAITKTQSADPKVGNQTPESRADQENWEHKEDYLMEAANYGLQAMHNLYYIQEPKLYSMGLYLESDNPARYVAAFNEQSEEAKALARFGYATLQGTAMFLNKFPNAPLELPLSRNKFVRRTTSLEQQCPRRDPPQCPPASLRYRTSDGSCNNLQHLWWGSAMSTMQRFLSPEYDDGVQSIRRSITGRPLPSAREVTNLVHEDKDVPLASVTHMLMQWGQFVDHDLTATGQSRGFNGTVPQCCLQGGIGFQPPEFMHPECLPIAVNLRDSFYGPLGVRCLEFLRSGPAPKEGCEFGPREQLSQVTSYLDASMVYSSNAMHSDSLRIFRNGLLQYGRIQSRKSSLPKRESDLCKRGSLSTTCFRAGDGRLSEQPALTSLHVVFLRLHNRIATELSDLNSHWSDEKLFQETRRIVGAIVQHITYREFLPIVLGPQVMKIFDLEVLKKGYYEGYDPTVNPTVANSFSTAAYRFGHSLVQQSFVRFDSNHRPIFNNVSIHDEFNNPANLETAGSIDRLLLGLVNQPCQRRDEFISEEITNHLFQTSGFAFGMDLASLNIQRGRDHGLPPYVRWREPCGLSPIRTFDDLDRVMFQNAARKFRSLYASVEDIDLYSAGLAEKSVVGGLVGPTFACIIGQQFSNLRRGDRFWYENPESESSFTLGQLQQIRRVTLAQVLCRTMNSIETLQPFVFLTADRLKNQRLSCDDPIIGQLNLEYWAQRPSEFRSYVDDSQEDKQTATETSDTIFRSKRENVNLKKKVPNQDQETFIPQKPVKTSINQNNRIVVKRPFGRPDNNNVTIVVNNNAVNSPIFVNEGIYGSHIKIQQHPNSKPTSNFNEALNFPALLPQLKPIPTTIPHLAKYPYVPHAFDDPNNPNPLVYGFRSPVFTQDDVFYDNYSATNPRPTLYTYYTRFQQKSTTQMPDREVDDYLINYGSSHHDSLPTHAYERPKPSMNSEHHYQLNDKQNPGYASPPASIRPSYDGQRPSTTTRPTFRPDYNSNDELYHKETLDYNRPKPSSNARPYNEMHHAQNPIDEESAVPVSSRPDPIRPNHQPYDTQKTGKNPHLQSNNLSKPNASYSSNLNRPHQNQWNSNGYQTRPGEKPYDHDDPDAYRKRPNVKLTIYNTDNSHVTNIPSSEYNSQAWKESLDFIKDSAQTGLYGFVPSSETNIPHQEYTSTSSSNSFPTDYNNHNRYFDITSTYYETTQLSTQSTVDVSSYTQESVNRPVQNSSLYQTTSHPIYHQKDDQLFSNTPYWLETSTKNSYIHRPEGSFIFKPTKVQSITIVTETIETVHHPGHSGYISQPKVSTEIPRPLVQQMKNNSPVTKRPGQYYYEKNVLHRYPDEMIGQIPKINYQTSEEKLVQERKITSEKLKVETSDSAWNSTLITNNGENKLLTIPTLTIHDNNATSEAVNERAFSTDIESLAPADVLDRTNYWVNSQEDLNLPSELEMPGIPSDEFTSAKELPKPITSKSHAT
ncbi:uncharacterized protein LOC109859976 isoform X2 [Pseudomyrmex gracilis]|uniref:uncharacterized protein LOC109859976 isoform X2 n=1 Tax=Pseudomyrmex gracilis TaxID=219809 RepID=UPI0009951771|nr:uncharacterized protein LOC109859976 isoform X2 [Pseudomyrmex gracilis]